MTKLVTWDKRWIQKFESPWGLLEKFKLANNAKINDIFKLFGSNHRTYYKKEDRNLIYLNGLNDDPVFNLLGISLRKHNLITLDCIVSIFGDRNEIKTYIDEELNFCPYCIKEGYHSVFHQFKLIKYCPFHKAQLFNSCPVCRKKYKYEVSDINMQTPFICNCGYAYLRNDINPITLLYSENKFIKHIDEDLRTWIKINRTSKDLNILLCDDLKSKDSFSNVLIIINEEQCNLKYRQDLISIKFIRNKQCSNFDIETTYRELYNSTFHTYKNIDKYIRKKLIYDHRKCITRLKRRFPDTKTCPFAYAYLHWKQEIKGLNNYWIGDNKNQSKKTSYQLLDFPSIYHLSTLQNIYRIYKNICNKEKIDPNLYELLWVINRAFAHLLLDFFYEWLNVADKAAPSNIFYKFTPFESNYFSFFTFKFEKESINFYYGPNTDKENIITNLKCPYV